MSSDSQNRDLANLRKGSPVDAEVAAGGYMRGDSVVAAIPGDDFAPFNIPFGRASGDGVTGLEFVEDGNPQRIAVDNYGHIWTNVTIVDVPPVLLYYDSAAEEAGALVKATPGRLWNVIASHSLSNATLYLQIFNSAAPAPGATPVYSIPFSTQVGLGGALISSVANLSLEAQRGRPFSVAMSVAISTTKATLTPAAAVGWFNVAYQ